jgi:hypothetical protein
MWVAASIIAIPIAVLAHELGHFLLYVAFGFPGATLHYESSTHDLTDRFWSLYRSGARDAAAALIAPWKVATAAAAGPVVTYGMTVAGCIAAVRTVHPLVVTVTIAANLRAVPIALSAIRGWTSGNIRNTDEANVAALTGIPEMLLAALAIASCVGSAVWVFGKVPRSERLAAIVSTIVGLAAGMVLYLIVGPRILP